MKRYIKPEILEEQVEIEDICSVSAGSEGDVIYNDESSIWPN